MSPATHTKESKETIQKKYRKEPKTPSVEGGLFPPGDWTDSKFREVREDWNVRRTQTAHPFDVAVYYFLKFHERHRSVTDLEMERTRGRIWQREQKTWLFISKLDPLDDFVTTAICDMALKGEVIDQPIPFFRWAKKEYQGYEL